MRKPRPLQVGSPVRIVAPSSPFERDRLRDGLDVLRSFGLVPEHSDRIFKRNGYLAGADDERAAEVVEAMAAKGNGAVMAARGGYGAMRILDRLASGFASFEPHIFMGFSDLTALHLAFGLAADLVTFHGPNANGLATLGATSVARTRATLLGLDREATFTYSGLRPLFDGRVRGRLVVGNLSLVAALIGTPWAAPLQDAILVLEEVGEPPYRVDRMLTQISMQPGAGGLAGLVFGDLGVAERDRAQLDQAVGRFTEVMRRPAVAGFPIGHGQMNHPVPEGVLAELDAGAGVLRVVEDPYQP